MDGEIKKTKIPIPIKPDPSVKTYITKEEDGTLVAGVITNPYNDKDPLIGKKIEVNLVDIEEFGHINKWGDQSVKDKKIEDFVNTSFNQSQRDTISELSALDRKASDEFTKQLNDAFISQDWEEYDRLMISRGISSNISIKDRAYKNIKSYKTYDTSGNEIEIPIEYQQPLFNTDSTVDQLMFKDNPEALKKLTKSEIETLDSMKNIGVPMNATSFSGTYKSIDLSTNATPFTPNMLYTGLVDLLGESKAKDFLRGSPSKNEIEKTTRLLLEYMQRPPLPTLMNECVKECRYIIATTYAKNVVKTFSHITDDKEYSVRVTRHAEYAQSLLDDDERLEEFMEENFIKGRTIDIPIDDLPYDPYDIPVLNFYFSKYDDFTQDLNDLRNNNLMYDEGYRSITKSNLRINAAVYKTFQLIGLNFTQVFENYAKKKMESLKDEIDNSESGVKEVAIKETVSININEDDEIW